jgi:Na+/proline symporter
LIDIQNFQLNSTVMKKVIAFAILFFVTTSSFSQQTNSTQTLTRQDYLTKSKNQKTSARVLLVGGAVLIGTGLLIGTREEATLDDAATGGTIASIGILSAIGSIPLFIASGRNKRKAMNVSTYFEIRQNPVQAGTRLTLRSSPALSLKLNL